MGTALLFGWGGTGIAGEAPSGGGAKPASRPLFSSGSKKTAPAAKPATPTPEPARPAAEDAAAIRKREEAAYLRRVAVCDKLLQIAYQTGDDTLQQKADQLSQLAFDVYMIRVAQAQGGSTEGDLEEQVLRKVEEKASDAATRLDRDGRAPAKPEAKTGWLSGWGRTER